METLRYLRGDGPRHQSERGQVEDSL